MLASIYEDGRVSAMRLFTVENSQPVLGETVYSYSVNDDGEETVTTFGRAYTKHNSTKEYISSTDSVKTKSSLSWNGWEVVNTESESDFFGRTTGKHYTVNLGEDDHPNFGTEYTYADTETTATNKISRVKNTLNGAVKSDYGYTYDNRGNILTVSKSGVLFQQYVYDEASQVKAEYNYAEKTAMTYVYDANGNIVSKTPYTNVTSSDLSTATQGTAIVYGYGDGNWSDKLTSYDGQTITYDASGNPTSYRGETVTWNGRLMTSYTKDGRRYEYSYNSDGMRTVKKVYENNELVYTHTYIWDGDVLLAGRMEVTDADDPITIRYLYDESGELYGMDYNGNGYFAFIKNLQGDIVSIVPLDSESNVELNIEYDAWGKPIFEESSLGAAFVKAMIMAAVNVGYRGYFYDFETDLYYLRSRYYDPEIGRFINADDTDYLGYDKSPLSMNLFAYGCNNAVNNIDPNGTLVLTGMAMTYLFAIIASFFAYAVCNTIINSYNSKFGFQNSWNGFVNALNSGAYSLYYKVTLASNVILNWTKYKLSTASKAVQLAVTAAKADAAIRTKVRKNSKDRYWSANLSTDHVDIGRALTYKEAINMVKSGKNVFTVTKSEAKKLAKAAYSNKNPVGPEIHNKNSQGKIKKGYFYYHYHVYNRKKPGHIWFLF